MPEENIRENKEWLVNGIENFLKNCSDEPEDYKNIHKLFVNLRLRLLF
jgi:hypothetical protein